MTASTEAEHWARQLAAWALPERVLKAVNHSPYAWPAKAFAHAAHARPDPVTGPLLGQLLGSVGSLLDVGAGTGRLCLPPAGRGHQVTAVEPNAAMAAELERQSTAQNADSLTVVRERWPDVAGTVGHHDVGLAANVVYDVGRIGPFLEALAARSRRAVVIELTDRHPWDGLRGYYRQLHGVELPDGPDIADMLAVIGQVLAVTPQRSGWHSPPAFAFESQEALFDLYAVRLCVPDERRPELESVLAPDIVMASDGSLVLRTTGGSMSTLWWETAGD